MDRVMRIKTTMLSQQPPRPCASIRVTYTYLSLAYLSRTRQIPSHVFRCKEVSSFSHDSRFSGSACNASSRNGVSGNEACYVLR